MTKEDIKKALEICTDLDYSCDNCPYDTVRNCNDRLCNDARELITEQEKEIKRLKAENDTNMQYIRMMGIQSHIKTSNERVKQAQTDTINTIVEYCENPNHWRELKDCKLFGGKSNDLRDFLNGIFKEGNNEN